MMDFLERAANLMKVGQEMAGGRKRGLIVFWVAFLIAVAIALKPAYDSVVYVFSHLNPAPIVVNIIISTILALISAAILLAIGATIGLIIGIPMRIGFATPINNRIVKMLNEFISLLRSGLEKDQNNNDVKKLLEDAEILEKQWKTSRLTRFIGRISGKPKKG